MGGSGESEIFPAPVTEQASGSTPPVLSDEQASSSTSTKLFGADKHLPCHVTEQIKQSQRHWSELSVSTRMPYSKKPFQTFRNLVAGIRGGRTDYEKAVEMHNRAVEMDNRKVFMELQSHPSRGAFFKTFGYSLGTLVPGNSGSIRGSSGLLRIGAKFAEGGQAELFHVDVTWSDDYSRLNGLIQERGIMKSILLRDLQVQWPDGYLQFVEEILEKWKSFTYDGIPTFVSHLHCGTLLEDGRFAFVMRREFEDLRSWMEAKMALSSNQASPPFSKDEGEGIMWILTKGMDWFHSHNIVHRDLKASNLLVGNGHKGSLTIYIADYECSIGVVGTNLFRAPEILQACKNRSVSRKRELFTKAVDVYSYGMTCYEILTGLLPFEGHLPSDYDHVLNGHRPELPPYVDDWICDLLRRCWDANPTKRPSFAKILSIIVANSVGAQIVKENYDMSVEGCILQSPNPTEPHS